MGGERERPAQIEDTLVTPSLGIVAGLLDRFEIEAELGHGGMGVVYRATARDGTPVALKVMTRPDDPELVRRFQRESMIRIEHPNVVRVLDADTSGAAAYIAFELLEGESVERIFARGTMSPEAAVELGVQTCAGLTAAHAQGVIHRDLKPSNIFRCKDGTYKILDFGIARFETSNSLLTVRGRIIGTPTYLSPEQARGDVSLDARCDLWSLGAVLYAALAGRPPFVRETMLGTLVAVIMDEHPPLAELVKDVPVDLANAIERALSKKREERFSSASELGAALASAALTKPRQPHRKTTLSREEKRVVAVLLADGVSKIEALESAVERRGGVMFPLIGRRAIGVFGGEAWEGDEVIRAISASLEARTSARQFAIASGRAALSGGHISGLALETAEAGLDASIAGVAIAPETARALRLTLPEVRPGVLELTEEHFFRWAMSALDAPAWKSLLLGREAELAQIGGALEIVRDEARAQVVIVRGPAGIGKSALKRTVIRLVQDNLPNVKILSANAEPLEKQTALSLFAAAFRARLGISGSRSSSPALAGSRRDVEAVSRLVKEVFGEAIKARAVIEFLGCLVGAYMPDSDPIAAARQDPQLMADRLTGAVRDYLSALAGAGPVALIFEDLQWADQASLELLADLFDRLEQQPLFLFLTARSEFQEATPQFLEGRSVIALEPRGLALSQVATFGAAIAGKPISEPLAKRIAERTGGNPLFVEHTVLELIEEDRLDEGLEELPLPLTVEAAVQSRLDHLREEEKEVSKRASIFGRPFTVEELDALGTASTENILTALVRKDLFRRSRGPSGAASFRFSNALVGEVAYRMLRDDLRAALHLRAATALSHAADPNAEEVARHFEAAGRRSQAADWYSLAAHKAAERGDGQAVVRLSDDALRLGLEPKRHFSLLMVRADALRFMGRREDHANALAAACSCASNDTQLARALSEQAAWLSSAGRVAEALSAAEHAVAAAARSEDREVRAFALGRRAMCVLWAGRVREAASALTEATAYAAAGSVKLRAMAIGWEAQLASARGDLGAAREAFMRAAELHRETGDVRRAAVAQSNLADTYNRVGAYREAEVALADAIAGSREVGSRLTEGYAWVNTGYALAMQNKSEEALAALERAQEIARGIQDARLTVLARLYLCRVRLALDPPEKVCALAESIAAGAERVGARGQRALALALASWARLLAQDVAGALAQSERALALRDEIGGVEEDEAEIFIAHARALLAAGRAPEALKVLERGSARIMAIAEGIGDAEWKRRFLRDVPANRMLFGVLEAARSEG